MANLFAHTELSTDDVERAKSFYGKLFDWKLQTMGSEGGMPYTMILSGKQGIGGIAGKQMPGQPTAWLPYVEVADVKKTLDAARADGANVVVDYMPIGEFGAIGVFVDPTGAALGVWEKPKGAAKKAAKKSAKKGAKKAAAKKGAKKAAAPKKGAAKKAKKGGKRK